MTYKFQISIKPCVNFSTHAAELYVVDDTSNQPLVKQKHLGNFATNDEAEVAAEKFCTELHAKLCVFVQDETRSLPNAKP